MVGLLLALLGLVSLVVGPFAVLSLWWTNGIAAVANPEDLPINHFPTQAAELLRWGGVAAVGAGAMLMWLSRDRRSLDDEPPLPPDRRSRPSAGAM